MEKLKSNKNIREKETNSRNTNTGMNKTGGINFTQNLKNISQEKNYQTGNLLTSSSKQSNTASTNLAKEYILEMIEKAASIGEFHFIHQTNQNHYENRLVQKKVSLISNDFNFDMSGLQGVSATNSKMFISNLFKTVYFLDVQSNLTQMNILNSIEGDSKLLSKNILKMNLFNIFEMPKLLLDSIIIEGENIKEDVKLSLLYEDLTLCVYKSVYANFLNLGDVTSNFNIISENKTKYFNFKPYLPSLKTNYKNYIKTFPENKILCMSKKDEIILNFSQFSDRLIIFNISSYAVIYNIVINPLDFTQIFNQDLTSCYNFFITEFMEKKWSIPEIDSYTNLTKNILNNKKINLNYKILANLLSRIDDYTLKYTYQIVSAGINQNKGEQYFNINLEKKIDRMYHCIMALVSHSIGNGDLFDFYELINYLSDLLNKLYSNSKLLESGNYSTIESSSLQYLFLKLYKRKINLKQILLMKDSKKKFYIPKEELIILFNSLTLGIPENEIKQIVNKYFPLDEFNNVLYPFIFKNEENIINDLILKKKGWNSFNNLGFFYNIDKQNSYSEFSYAAKKTKRKYSDINLYQNNISHFENSISHSNSKNKSNNYSQILNYITGSVLDIQISNLIYIPHLNISLTLSNKNQSKILIFKINPEFSNKSKIFTKFILLGYIELYSAINPKIMTFLDDKNLLLTQSLNRKTNLFDLIIVDIYKDIVDVFQTNQLWKISIKDSHQRKQNISNYEIKEILYLPGNKHILIRNSNNEVKSINPMTKCNELSIKYFYEKNKESVYDSVCRAVCEKNSEITGDNEFKIVKDLITKPILFSSFITFNTHESNIPFEYFVMLNQNEKGLSISGLGIYTFTLNVKAKSADNPIVELEALRNISLTEKSKILKNWNDSRTQINKICSQKDVNNNFEIISGEKSQEEVLNFLVHKLKPKIKDIVISTSEIKKTISEILQDNEKLALTHNFKNSHFLISLLKKLNSSCEYSDLVEFTSKIILDDQSTNSENINVDSGWNHLHEIFFHLGTNSMSLFRRIKNNKIEFLKFSKSSFVQILNRKIDLFREKKAFNVNKILNQIDQSKLDLEEISYDTIQKNIFRSRSLLESKSKLSYEIDNINKIRSLMTQTSLKTHDSNLEEINPTNNKWASPLDSGLIKLITAFLNSGVKIENSFKIFDQEKEEIIDKKQFVEGLKFLEVYSKMNSLEVNALFSKIDTNDSNCVTEDEYYFFVECSNMKELVRKIKQIKAEILSDKFFINLSDNNLDSFNEEKIESILNKRKTVYIKYNDDWVYLTFLKFFQFLEINLGMQIELSFKFFDTLHLGLVFYSQFHLILNQFKSGLSMKEIDAMFSFIDSTHKKFYIFESEFTFALKNILYNPGVNRKAYVKLLNEENKNLSLIKSSIGLNILNQKVEFSPKINDYSNILLNIFDKVKEHLKIKNSNLINAKIIDNFLLENLNYLPIEKFIYKLQMCYPQISNFEIKVVTDYYLDVEKHEVIFTDEIKKKIESVILFMYNKETKNNLVSSKDNINPLKTELSASPTNAVNSLPSNRRASIKESILSNLMETNVDFLRKSAINPYLFYTLKIIQETLRKTSLTPEDIFFQLDEEKKGFLTLNSFLKVLPLKFNINLTINQQILFFDYLDRDKDGLALYSDFQIFFDTAFSLLTFEDSALDFNILMESFQENFLILINRLETVDIRNIFDMLDLGKGFLQIDDILLFFNKILNLQLCPHDAKLIIDIIFNQNGKNILIGLRKFILMLEIMGVNTRLYTYYNKLNEIVDEDVLMIIQKLNKTDTLGKFKLFEDFDKNKDGFLTPQELVNSFLSVYNTNQANDFNKLKNSLMRITNRLVDCNNDNLISITNLVFLLNYFEAVYSSYDKNTIALTKFEVGSLQEINSFNFFSFNKLNNLSSDVSFHTSDFHNLNYKGVFSGMLIYSKYFVNNSLINTFNKINKKNKDYFLIYAKQANDLIIKNFNSRIKDNLEHKIKFENISEISETVIPCVKLNIFDQKEMTEREIFSSKLGESFEYYHPELKRKIKVTKYRKSLLTKTISDLDGQNLFNQIEYSIKVNRFLKNIDLERSSMEKEETNFNFNKMIFSNIGSYTREVVISQKEEEEFFLLDEMIDEEKYISFEELIKLNGGLLNVPELHDTDLAFYIVRFWAKKILSILLAYQSLNLCFKYLDLSDIFISKDGKDVKIKVIQHLNYFNNKGRIIAGPDLRNIFLLYNKRGIFVKESDINSPYYEKTPPLTFEDYEDPFVAPEVVLKDSKSYTSKIDTWIFGVFIFSILFGKQPISYIKQLKEFVDTQTNLIFDKINFPMNIVGMSETENPNKQKSNHISNFLYYPFKNIDDMKLPTVFIESIKLKSFSAVVDNKHLNRELESRSGLNGLGIILDLINACMSPDPELRPDLNKLYNSDLFKFDNYEMILVNNFTSNCLNHISPGEIIIKNMLLPLRQIASRVMQKNKLVNDYENFIFDVIFKLNDLFFGKKTQNKLESNNKNYSQSDVRSLYKSNSDDSPNNSQFVNEEYNKPNSQIIKTVFEHKVIDILIFLILRHFNTNLKTFKKISDNKLAEIMKVNSHLDKKSESELRKQSLLWIKEETEKQCGRLIHPLVNFLHNCVLSMKDYNHAVTSYVENIIEFITRLFIGEDYLFSSELLMNKQFFTNTSQNSNLPNSSCDKIKLKKYLHFRTFFRNEHHITPEFKEDEADKIWSILNNNTDLCDRETFWSSQLNYIITPLFLEAITETGNGNYKYPVIKNFLAITNEQNKNVNDILENPLINNNLNQFYNVSSHKSKFPLMSSNYLTCVLSLNECCLNLLGDNSHSESAKANKKSGLSYLISILRTRDVDKIRALFDFKITKYVEKFLFTNFNDPMIKIEVVNLLKEISFGLVDIDEVSWLFGNNYNKIFEKTIMNKTDPLEASDLNEELNWDSNFSLVQFLNKTLHSSHSFILQFTDRFLGIGSNLNIRNTKESFSKRSQALNYIKEMGQIFVSPIFLKPLIKILQKQNESIGLRQTCLEILFNLMISNNEKLIKNLNSSLCNIYEALTKLIQSNNLILFNNNEELQEEFNSIGTNLQSQREFKITVKNIIYILIEIQNPLIKSQMFKSPTLGKYLCENSMLINDKYDIDEIYEEFKQLKDKLNFSKLVEKINKLINSLKCWIQHYYLDRLIKTQEIDTKIEECVICLIHILNVEWKEGLKTSNTNCLIFNIVKMFEWLCKKKLQGFLFNLSQSTSVSLIISFMTKIKDTYNLIIVEDPITDGKNNKLKQLETYEKVKNSEKNQTSIKDKKYMTLQKIYHFVCIKLLNMLSNIFSLNDEYYNELLCKSKFGFLIGEIMKTQFGFLSQILEKKKNDINILNNYIQENKVRLELIEGVLNSKNEEMKIQFLESNFIEFMISKMMTDYRRFYTDYKKLSFEFLVFKEGYPVRVEAISFINLIITKRSLLFRGNSLIFDEMLKSIRRYHLISQELNTIKNAIKGTKIHSVFLFLSVLISSSNTELGNLMEEENVKEYLNYAVAKDPKIRKVFPTISEYL